MVKKALVIINSPAEKYCRTIPLYRSTLFDSILLLKLLRDVSTSVVDGINTFHAMQISKEFHDCQYVHSCWA